MAKGKRKQGERNWVSYLIDLEKNRDLKSAFLKGKKKKKQHLITHFTQLGPIWAIQRFGGQSY